MKILVIEDDDSTRENMLLLLENEGFEVEGAATGIAGLDLAVASRPDLIICDITMPGVDGFDVLGSVRASKALASVPFIFVTARGDRATMRRGMNAGADDYLSKPFTREELVAAIIGRIRHARILRGAGRSDESERIRSLLTSRELEVLKLVGDGLTSKEIAINLEISVKTVDVHRSNIMQKLSVRNAAGLVRYAMQLAVDSLQGA